MVNVRKEGDATDRFQMKVSVSVKENLNPPTSPDD